MTWFTGQLLVLLAVAFLLGLLLGYVIWIWGWRSRVEESVEVATSTRDVTGEDDPRLARERREWRTAIQARDEAIAARDERITRLRTGIGRLREGITQRDEAIRARDDRLLEMRTALAERPPATQVVDDGDDTDATDMQHDATVPVDARRDEVDARPDEGDAVSDEPVTGRIDEPDDERTSAIGLVTDDLEVVHEPDRVEVVHEPDDLTLVEGIGPKMQAALHDAGIVSFEQLGRASERQIRAAIDDAGMSFAPSVPTWSRQARLLAAGDDEAVDAFQSHLVAGREVDGR